MLRGSGGRGEGSAWGPSPVPTGHQKHSRWTTPSPHGHPPGLLPPPLGQWSLRLHHDLREAQLLQMLRIFPVLHENGFSLPTWLNTRPFALTDKPFLRHFSTEAEVLAVFNKIR